MLRRACAALLALPLAATRGVQEPRDQGGSIVRPVAFCSQEPLPHPLRFVAAEVEALEVATWRKLGPAAHVGLADLALFV